MCSVCKREFNRTADVGGVGFRPTGDEVLGSVVLSTQSDLARVFCVEGMIDYRWNHLARCCIYAVLKAFGWSNGGGRWIQAEGVPSAEKSCWTCCWIGKTSFVTTKKRWIFQRGGGLNRHVAERSSPSVVLRRQGVCTEERRFDCIFCQFVLEPGH